MSAAPRVVAAVAAGKATAAASRLTGRGGGTSLPGLVAERISPHLLGDLLAASATRVAAVTGSNGKTTTARLLAALLTGEGLSVGHNRAGANLARGITALAVSTASWTGRLPDGVLVAEVDEGALLEVTPQARPAVLVVTNLFRDQLDRFGEIYAVADALAAAAARLPADATLVLNADDPLVAALADRVSLPVLTFGFDGPDSLDALSSAADSIRCPRCRVDLTYTRVWLSHLGDYHCPSCGFTRPQPDVAVTAVRVLGSDRTQLVVRTPDATVDLDLPQGGVHVAYNAAAALAAAAALGVAVPHAADSLAGVRPAFGRLETLDAGGRAVALAFAKNPTSFNTTLHTVMADGGPRHLMMAVSNTGVDGEDFGWLWDVDVEPLADRVEHVTLAGLRADELATRLKYAGVPESATTVVTDPVAALDAALALLPHGERLVVVAGYTPTIQVREAMRRRGWTNRYWQS